MNGRTITTRRMGLLAPAMAMLMVAGAACAQSAPVARKGYDSPMPGSTKVARAEQPRKEKKEKSKGERQISITRSDDDGVFTVTINGDDIHATIDGEDVPADRIERDENTIKLLDGDGDVAAEFQVSGAPGEGEWKAFEGTAWAAPQGQWQMAAPGAAFYGQPGVAVAGGDNPPVMLGITMSEPSETLLENLGLDEGSGVLIDQVYEGLPAEEAGMKGSDVLVELDGNSPLTQEDVRKILRSKEPGDVVRAVVVRKGEKKELKIKLKAFDAEKLGGGLGGQMELFTPQDEQAFKFYSGGGNADAHKAIEEAMKSLEKSHGMDADELREHVHKALEEALKSLDEGGSALRMAPRMRAGPGGQGGTVILGPQPGQVYTTPGQPVVPATPRSAHNGDLSRQMDELRAQLDEVQRSRDELKQQLDEIKAMLKDMRDHR